MASPHLSLTSSVSLGIVQSNENWVAALRYRQATPKMSIVRLACALDRDCLGSNVFKTDHQITLVLGNLPIEIPQPICRRSTVLPHPLHSADQPGINCNSALQSIRIHSFNFLLSLGPPGCWPGVGPMRAQRRDPVGGSIPTMVMRVNRRRQYFVK